MHPRTMIRAALADRLRGATDAEDRVYLNPTTLLRNRQPRLPAIAIMMLGETVDDASYQTAPREITRLLDISVCAYVSGNGGEELSDRLDEIAEQIEAAISADDSLGCGVDDCVLVETAVNLPMQGDTSVAAIDLVWRVTYRSYMPAEVSLDRYERSSIKYDVGGAFPAEDHIELPQ